MTFCLNLRLSLLLAFCLNLRLFFQSQKLSFVKLVIYIFFFRLFMRLIRVQISSYLWKYDYFILNFKCSNQISTVIRQGRSYWDWVIIIVCIVLSHIILRKREKKEKKKRLLLQVPCKCRNNTNSIVIENRIFLSYNLCNLQFI